MPTKHLCTTVLSTQILGKKLGLIRQKSFADLKLI